MLYGRVKACVLRILLHNIPSYLVAGLETSIIKVCHWKNSRRTLRVSEVYDVLNVSETSRFQAGGMIAHNCLGLQFSMGVKKLQRSLSRSSGREVTYERAQELSNIHKDTFHTYWDWNENNIDKYESRVPLRTRDGWFLFCDNPNPRSAGNMPIQGAGGAILRRAIKYAQKAGIVVIAPLHDAIYAIHKIEDTDAVVAKLRECMNQAFKDFYNRDIRMDAKTWKYGEIFIEEKGAKYYHALKDKFQNPGDALWMVELGE